MRLLPYIALAALLLPACTSNRFYTPNTMQIPMLSEKGQATVQVGIAKNKHNSGWEVQGIYSPLPHLGLMVNHFDLHYSGDTYSDFSQSFYALEYEGQTRLTEGAVGGYLQTGPQKEYLISLFGGFGKGRTENRYLPQPDPPGTETFNSSWNYQRWFIQPALGMKYRRFQVGTGLRFVWVDYLNGDINSRVGQVETDRIALLEQNSPLALTEIAWTFGWHFRPVVISLNSTAVVRGKNSIRDLNLASNFVSLTVGLNLHELKK
ncbi:MAG: hypothetical protein R3D58_21735 [Saprospiraceae bacterium]|nr:hypothetical protein [Lewinellaceae bacterium]